MAEAIRNGGSSRRAFLAGTAGTLATPFLWPARARAAQQQITVRTPGGVYDSVKARTVYEPFRKLTGIEVVPVASTAAKILAMYKAGELDLDVVDSGNDVLLQLERVGTLQPVSYQDFRYTDPADLDPPIRRKFQVGEFEYGFVLGYNTTAFPSGKEPKSWAEFWDLKAFPGPRTLAGMDSGAPNLEFALIADGVPMDKLYPLDISRAFRALSRIRSAVPKFWDTGALSQEMLSDKEVVLGAFWSTRVQAAADAGAPVAIQWNQNEILVQAYGITKGAKNPEGALKFIDYTLSPAVQARWLGAYRGIPVNRKAYPEAWPGLIDPRTKTPWTRAEGFLMDIDWWADNRAKVATAWSQWIIG